MRISLFSQSLAGLSLEEAVRVTAEAGFSAIEIMCVNPHFGLDEARSDPERVAGWVERSGLSVSALSLSNNFTDKNCLDEEVEAAKQFIRLAPIFNTTVIKLTPGPPASAQAAPAHWDCLETAIGELIPTAGEAGVRLAFETHMRQLSDTLASSRRLIEIANSDTVGLTVDFSNLAFAGENMHDVVSDLKDHMYNTHDKNGYVDKTGGWHFQRLDEGLTDYGHAIKMLREADYDGYLTIECLDPEARDNPHATIRRDLEILTQYLCSTDDSAGGEML